MSAHEALGVQFQTVTPPHPMGSQYNHLMASETTAHVNGEHVGTVEYGPDHKGKQMLIQTLGVHPEYRGRGLASALMDKVVEATPPDWTIWHGPQSEEARHWFARYSQRPGFQPERHRVARAGRDA